MLDTQSFLALIFGTLAIVFGVFAGISILVGPVLSDELHESERAWTLAYAAVAAILFLLCVAAVRPIL